MLILQDCKANFDEEFARGFREFLDKGPANSHDMAANNSNNNKDQPDSENYTEYICEHLKSKLCPSHCDQLW